MNRTQIQAYINNFRRHLSGYLRPGIGLNCLVYPVESGGAVLVFRVGAEVENDDEYQELRPSLGNALSNVEQHAFGGDLDGFTFAGTNTILEPSQIIFIKDGNVKEWSDEAAAKDVQAVVRNERRMHG